jgi:hypothetical protein
LSGLDFSQLTQRSTSDSATEPERIFSSLPSKDAEKYDYPRNVQDQVWEEWRERRTERDLVIKMNTGSGKTVVGLIALKSCLNEGVGPAVYVTPDPTLTGQVLDEARQLGLAVVEEPNDPSFRQGRAILVVNIRKLFNGRSVFGVQGASRPPIELGALLIDDAHACLATVESQFTLRIPDEHPAYGELFELFEPDLALQSHAALLDLKEGDSSAVLPIPFWAWADKQRQLTEILHRHRESDEMKFQWPLIVDSLPICRAAISTSELEISPPCPPVERIPSFASAKRRIYLTATLPDDGVLVTHFAADPESVAVPITPRRASDLGDRMILTPQQTFPACDDEQLEEFVADQAKERNVVVIVPSWARARRWERRAAYVRGAEGLPEVLATLRKGQHVGLVVFVNKYDGIDLPDDACHFLVIDGLPEAMGALDRLETIALEGSDAQLRRQIQRIEQGMGRGVRSNKDFCVVLLLGRRLTERLYPPTARRKFSPATRAQLELSDGVAMQLEGRPFEEIQDAVERCLKRDPKWIEASRSALADVKYPERSEISPIATARRAAFDLASARRFGEAAAQLRNAVDATADKRMKGFLMQEEAAYLHYVDKVQAQERQLVAFGQNPALSKPTKAIDYTRLSESAPQAKAATAFLESLYKRPNELLFGVTSMLERLEPDPDPASTKLFEQAMKSLGQHLGFSAHCPDEETRIGPDVLWLLGERRYLVIECKSGSTSPAISKEYMGQLASSLKWFEEQYGGDGEVVPVLVHPSSCLTEHASTSAGDRVMTFEKLAELREAVYSFAKAVASSNTGFDPNLVGKQLSNLRLDRDSFIQQWTVQVKRNR